MGGPGEGIEFDGCGDDGRIEGGEEEEEAGVGVEERRFLSYPSWFGVRYHLWIGNIHHHPSIFFLWTFNPFVLILLWTPVAIIHIFHSLKARQILRRDLTLKFGMSCGFSAQS